MLDILMASMMVDLPKDLIFRSSRGDAIFTTESQGKQRQLTRKYPRTISRGDKSSFARVSKVGELFTTC